MLVVKGPINEPDMVDSNITGIKRLILGETDKHSLPNKWNETQGSSKLVSPCWLMINSQSVVNVFMNKELVKDTCNTHVRIVHVHCNPGTIIIRTEATLPGLGTVWFEDRCIANILPLLKAKLGPVACMIACRETNHSLLCLTRRSFSMRAAMGSTIMICETVIMYLSIW